VTKTTTSKTNRKRKSTSHSNELERSSYKKSLNQHKSVATIEDSDEEADFAHPHTEVRREFTATADELIEQVQQQQEEKKGRREAAIEKGDETVLDESITTVANKTIEKTRRNGRSGSDNCLS
jgi:hypothetical protein